MAHNNDCEAGYKSVAGNKSLMDKRKLMVIVIFLISLVVVTIIGVAAAVVAGGKGDGTTTIKPPSGKSTPTGRPNTSFSTTTEPHTSDLDYGRAPASYPEPTGGPYSPHFLHHDEAGEYKYACDKAGEAGEWVRMVSGSDNRCSANTVEHNVGGYCRLIPNYDLNTLNGVPPTVTFLGEERLEDIVLTAEFPEAFMLYERGIGFSVTVKSKAIECRIITTEESDNRPFGDVRHADDVTMNAYPNLHKYTDKANEVCFEQEDLPRGRKYVQVVANIPGEGFDDAYTEIPKWTSNKIAFSPPPTEDTYKLAKVIEFGNYNEDKSSLVRPLFKYNGRYVTGWKDDSAFTSFFILPNGRNVNSCFSQYLG